MLTCNTCIRRCLRVFVGDSIRFTPSPRPLLATNSIRQTRRNYSSTTNDEAHQHDVLKGRASNGQSEFEGRSYDGGQRNSEKRRTESSKGVVKAKTLIDSSLEKELRYLHDPLKLAEFVRKTLRQDEFEKAEQVIHAISKTVPCTVSWNHLIDYQLSRGKMNGAIKTYNDMKKRGQKPDPHTYTIIFNGCSLHPDSNQALSKVISIYHSMLAENSTIKPNTHHMNAVLKMCARAKDLDAMCGVAGQMPTKGLQAPNNLTYTTIFNALRQYAAVGQRSTLSSTEKSRNVQEAILNARFLWRDITKRWRDGDIWIDEELVCAMGRLLVLGQTRDKDDVLSLIEQAMDIPRQVPHQGSPIRIDRDVEPVSEASVLAVQEPQAIAESDASKESPSVETNTSETTTPAEETLPTDQFKLVEPPRAPSGIQRFPKPGRNSLSLVMLALLELKLTKAATKYWNIFTKEAGVQPDTENYNAYLRILRVARASTETAVLVHNMPRDLVSSSTIRIAMACCKRDKNNHHAFSNAGKVRDVMQNSLANPDVLALEEYLILAINSTPKITTSPKATTTDDPVIDPLKERQGQQILRALHRLGPSTINLKASVAFGPSRSNDQAPRRGNSPSYINNLQPLLSLLQRMISAYDILQHNKMVPPEKYAELTKERSKLAAFVTRHKQHTRRIAKSAGHGEINKEDEEDQEDVPVQRQFQLPEFVRFLNSDKHPQFQRRVADARQTRETWAAFLDELSELERIANSSNKTASVKGMLRTWAISSEIPDQKVLLAE